jgi:hypothetical protein
MKRLVVIVLVLAAFLIAAGAAQAAKPVTGTGPVHLKSGTYSLTVDATRAGTVTPAGLWTFTATVTNAKGAAVLQAGTGRTMRGFFDVSDTARLRGGWYTVTTSASLATGTATLTRR